MRVLIKTVILVTLISICNYKPATAAFPIHSKVSGICNNDRQSVTLGNNTAYEKYTQLHAPIDEDRGSGHKKKWLAAILSFPGGILGLGRLYLGYYWLGGIEFLFFMLLFTSSFLVGIGVLGVIFNFIMGIADFARILQLPNRHGRARALNPKRGEWEKG